MPVDFYTHKPTTEQLQLVEKLATLIDTETRILSFPQHSPDICVKNNAIIVSLGKVASTAIESSIQDSKCIGITHIQLAHPSDLSKEGGKKEAREEAFAALTKLKEDIQANRFQPVLAVLTDADLPEITAQQILMLKSITDKQSLDGVCFQTTKSGKLVEIGNKKREGSNADIHISFEELFMVRTIMDLLQVKEITLVPASPIQQQGA